MDIKKIVDDIKTQIRSEDVMNKIASDLGLKLDKSNKCLCFNHSEKVPSMSFDTKKKKFRCFSCSFTYDIFNHYTEFYNKSFIEAIKSIVSDFNISTDKLYYNTDRKVIKPPTIHNNNTSNVIDYINKRCISEKTIKYANIKADDKNNIVFEYRNELGEHITNKYRPARKINKEKKEMKMWFEKETNINTLYLMDKVNTTIPLLICEGEFDALSAIEAGYKNTVSVPTGCKSTEWITTNWTFLEQFEEIILWYDNDDAGKDGVKEVFNRLNNSSVKIVYNTLTNDINELLYKYDNKKVLEAIESAEMPIIDDVENTKSIGSFSIYEAETIETGIENIDDKIVGFPLGSVNIITGKSGDGKSTILNQFFIGESIKQGYKVFLFSGELIKENAKGWLLDTLANENDLLEFTSKRGKKYKKISTDAINRIDEKIKDKFYLYTGENYNIKPILDKMEIMVKRYGVKVFCLDNLMVLEDNETDEYMAQANIIKSIKNFAKKYKCVIHIVAHPKKGELNDREGVSGTAKVTNLADYVTIIKREYNEDGSDKFTSFKIDKDRYTGHKCKVALRFDRDRRRFYSNDDKYELGVDYLDSRFIQVGLDDFEW